MDDNNQINNWKDDNLESNSFPKTINKIQVPPIKCQGIKSKLIEFIFSNIKWDGNGTWYEPFMGSGVVSFNAGPSKAILSDINPHLICFYRGIHDGEINVDSTKRFLEGHGKKLRQAGKSEDSYYYEIRRVFNETEDPLYFLFLNRSCYNGLIRFNSEGKFNTPFGKKPQRFSKSYITKIVNQVQWVSEVLSNHDIKLKCCDWKEALMDVKKNDFVYIDPPYYGRHATYYNNWTEENAKELLEWSRKLKCGFAISLWWENKYRENDFIEKFKEHCTVRANNHYYFLGSHKNKRHKMVEALIISPDYATKEKALLRESFKHYSDG